MNAGSPVSIRTAIADSPPAVVLVVKVEDETLRIDMTTPQAVDNMIESLKMARVAAFGLDVPSHQPLGYRYAG